MTKNGTDRCRFYPTKARPLVAGIVQSTRLKGWSSQNQLARRSGLICRRCFHLYTRPGVGAKLTPSGAVVYGVWLQAAVGARHTPWTAGAGEGVTAYIIAYISCYIDRHSRDLGDPWGVRTAWYNSHTVFIFLRSKGVCTCENHLPATRLVSFRQPVTQ